MKPEVIVRTSKLNIYTLSLSWLPLTSSHTSSLLLSSAYAGFSLPIDYNTLTSKLDCTTSLSFFSTTLPSQVFTMSSTNKTDSRSEKTPLPLSQQNKMCVHHNIKRIPPSMVGINPKARYIWFRGRKIRCART